MKAALSAWTLPHWGRRFAVTLLVKRLAPMGGPLTLAQLLRRNGVSVPQAAQVVLSPLIAVRATGLVDWCRERRVSACWASATSSRPPWAQPVDSLI